MKPSLVVFAGVVVVGCAHVPPQRGDVQEGLGSFYAESFNGKTTASGTRFDNHAFVCAHRTFPFGAQVRVTDLDDGRSVVVTVVDRGPFVPGRIIDLSLAAAQKLGMVDKGVARVRVERLR